MTAKGEDLILVGRVAGAFGIKGEVRITAFTAEPLSLVDYKTLLGEDGQLALTLLGGRVAKGGVVARAKEITTREEAEAARGLQLFIPRALLPPVEDEDEFYIADLVGMTVVSAEGDLLGHVRSVRDFGAGDLLEVAPPAGESWWLPFTNEAVPEVQVDRRTIVALRPDEVE
jgi:16S rRNA processing protein RimM